MRVMIVEDEAFVALDLERIVQEAGHLAIGPVNTVEQALAYAPKAEIALVDLGLADGLSGSQLARRLIDRFGISVIFVTGAPGDIGYGLEGAVDVVSKPFTDERLIQAIEKAVHQRPGHSDQEGAFGV